MSSPSVKEDVLILDDEPNILSSLTDLLEDSFVVSTAQTGEAALDLLKCQEISVVLSDQRMPGMSGDEFLRRAGEISQATRILITAYADMDALIRAVNYGQIYAYVAKPWDPLELRFTVQRAADHFRLAKEVAYERGLLHALMDNVPDPVCFKDSGLHFVRMNKAHARRLGRPHPGEAIGRTDLDFAGAQAPAATAAERELLRTGSALVGAVERETGPDGTVTWFSTTKVPILGRGGRPEGLVAISRDISDLKRAEEELRTARDELELRVRERTARLEHQAHELTALNSELEAFTYSVSHDLRTPVRHISGFSALVLEEFGPQLPPQAQKDLLYVRDGAHRMGTMIEELLNLSRIGRRELRRSPVDLRALVGEVFQEMAPDTAGRDLRIEIGELPCLECEPELMKIALTNLISNALKFTRPRKPAVIEIGQQQSPGRPVFFVRDNGVGFDLKRADNLFGPFQRLHPSQDFEGSGIGLATVQRIISKHGGTIWADAAPDRGATFYFTLDPPDSSW